MGCFSYKCKECGKPINSDSITGEKVKLFYLKDGKVLESMEGNYDSYGRVFDKKWKCEDWGDMIGVHFNRSKGDGISAVHTKCFTTIPTTISEDDPDQGWGKMRKKHL